MNMLVALSNLFLLKNWNVIKYFQLSIIACLINWMGLAMLMATLTLVADL